MVVIRQIFRSGRTVYLQDCYEVSGDVIEKFRENYDENLWSEIFIRKKMENIS